jgi:hypothetical protein
MPVKKNCQNRWMHKHKDSFESGKYFLKKIRIFFLFGQSLIKIDGYSIARALGKHPIIRYTAC